MLEFVHTVCSMQVQLARLVNVRIGRSTDLPILASASSCIVVNSVF